MNFDRDAARAAGYTEAEIDAYLRNRPSTGRDAVPADQSLEPPPPTTRIESVDTVTPAIATGALAAGPVVEVLKEAAPYAASAYGLYKGGQLVNRAGELMNRFGTSGGALPPAGTPGSATAPIGASNAPVAPAAPAAAQPVAPRNIPITQAPAAPPMQPVAPVQPTAPTTMTAGARAPVSAAPGVVDRATSLVRQLALEKLMPAAAGLARAAGPAGLAYGVLAPNPTGPAVPSSGRLRGSEINPLTGQGWTADEIRQYESNPAAYDQMLGQQRR